ncbi:SDR family NAD(P)-dependent oxidoreductase [Prosthecobacter sp.]|uniref:SDR family NAD(P)-dependent oxidoreductase n=1 Tax=Prosthecobacter sp. TaxID=1965333 RepID=UPI00378336D4
MHTLSNNKTWALITGASSGFGEEFARQYAAQGHSLILVARRKDRLEKLAESLRPRHPVEVLVEAVDLSDLESVRQLHRRVQDRGITIDVMINNAGYGLQQGFQDTNLPEALGMVQLDITSLTAVTHLFAADMRNRGRGKILLVASLLAYVSVEGFAVYSAAKAYVLRLGEALHREMRRDGITVTTLCPGISDTGFAEAARMQVSPELKLLMMKPEPVVRAGIRALNHGRMSVVPGLANKIMALFIRATPRSLHQAVFAKVMNPILPNTKKS